MILLGSRAIVLPTLSKMRLCLANQRAEIRLSNDPGLLHADIRDQAHMFDIVAGLGVQL